MRKPIFTTLIFLAALTIGIAISFIFYCINSRPNEDVTKISVQPASENKEMTFDADSTKPWILKISPCKNKNSITSLKSDWKDRRVISGGVVNKWAVCGSLPKYPRITENERISDVVLVEIIINETGEVKEAKAKAGNHIFFGSAVNAAYTTRFVPRFLGGTVYKVKGILMYKFDANDETWLQDPSAPDNPFKK